MGRADIIFLLADEEAELKVAKRASLVAVVKNPPANAGDRFEPWSRKIPHAVEQLSPCTMTTEPAF